MKMNRYVMLSLPLSLLLCSFAEGRLYTLADYHYSYGIHVQKVGRHKVGDKIKIDLGRDGVIGHYMILDVSLCLKYSKEIDSAYIYSHGMFVAKDAVSSLQQTLTVSYSQSYSFAYQKAISASISNKISAQLGLNNFGQIDESYAITKSESASRTQTYTFGHEDTETYSYTYNLNHIPDHYEFAPAVVCDAKIVYFYYTIYDQYWWGDYPSRNKSKVNVANSVLIYNPSSLVKTLVVRPHHSSAEPVYYL